MVTAKRLRVLLSIIVALGLTLILGKTIFFTGIPKVNAEKVRRIAKNIRDDVTIFKNTFTYKISAKKINYDQILQDIPSNDYEEVAVISSPELTPAIPPPNIINMSSVSPTETPIAPTPTEIQLNKTVPTINFKWPTAVPTIKKKQTIIEKQPTPTPFEDVIAPTTFEKPTPTIHYDPIPVITPIISNPLKISNPLDQPYYNPNLAYKCYNTTRFIQYYANSVNPNQCYTNIEAVLRVNIVPVSILGKTIYVHKNAYLAFKAVEDELEQNSVARAYKINKNTGAFDFRCNVNSSKNVKDSTKEQYAKNKYDVCNQDCNLSAHSFGIAVDINSDENPNDSTKYTMPMEVVDIFESYGFRWGGRYKAIFGSKTKNDPMHFEYMYDLCKDLK